jgi:hypothetical protein
VGLAVSWNLANRAVLANGKRTLLEGTSRCDGLTAIGVNETCGAMPARRQLRHRDH